MLAQQLLLLSDHAAIERLAVVFPAHLQFHADKRISHAGMRYKFKHHGGLPLMVRGGRTSTGRPAVTTGRAMTAAQRQRKSRYGSVAPRQWSAGAPAGNQNAARRRDMPAQASDDVNAVTPATLVAAATRLAPV